ncbi:hypothetical protein AURDEDRAFT_155343 [Auricularia subglabra TFB-10046 SS5]|nr:hypothetical protein AURDEDRAFT_155343 [Auricularia subglabra TFB-10046 SS5]
MHALNEATRNVEVGYWYHDSTIAPATVIVSPRAAAEIVGLIALGDSQAASCYEKEPLLGPPEPAPSSTLPAAVTSINDANNPAAASAVANPMNVEHDSDDRLSCLNKVPTHPAVNERSADAYAPVTRTVVYFVQVESNHED